jgi:tetratricopeptide (TPR) repeat protein
VRTVLLAVSLLAAAAVARAEPDSTAQAREHYEAGRALFKIGDYREAMREFALGYELSPKPEFLINVGHCHRRLGQLEQARDQYQRFLRDAPADHKRRHEVEVLVGDVEHELAARDARPAPPPVAPPPASAPLSAPVVAPPPAAAATPAVTLTAAPPPKKSFIRRHWWIIPVATVAAAGLAVGLGVGLTRSGNNPCADPSIVCVPVK